MLLAKKNLSLSFAKVIKRSYAAIKNFLLADIGEGIAEVQIIQWNVKVGDKVTQFDSLAEVQSDKATIEITSPYTGTITHIYSSPGDTVKTGGPLATFTIEEEEADPSDILMENSNHTTITKSNNEERSNGKQEDTFDLPRNPNQNSQNNELKILATPKIKAMAQSLNIDLSQIRGSGSDGRILEQDIMSHIANTILLRSSNETNSRNINEQDIAGSSKPNSTCKMGIKESNLGSIVVLTPIQTAMFQSMQRSLSIPHFSYSEEVDMTDILKIKAQLEVSFSALLLKILSQAIEEYPLLNCTIYMEGDEIIKGAGGNAIGLAIDTPLGLVVPVVSNIFPLSLKELSEKVKYDVIPRARSNKLTLSEIKTSNACITMSNIGAAIENTKSISQRDEMPAIATPRILYPQVSIVAITKAKKQKETGRMLGRICWSADHRVVDGVTLASATATFKYYLENPMEILGLTQDKK